MTTIALSRRTLLAALGASVVAPPIGVCAQDAEAKTMMIRMTFNDLVLNATLYDNPTARDFASLLPLRLSIEDFGHNEKIVRLPRRLTEAGSGPFSNERPGDLCYFKPWGNLALFYDDYRWDGLIRLGRFEGGFEPLRARGEFPVRIERI